jgi:hypothetical protein
MRYVLLLSAAFWLAPFGHVRAQSGAERAFVALRATHIGALTPIMTPAMISRRLNGAQLAIRYGLRDENDVRAHSVAGSGILAIGLQSSVSITAGVQFGQGSADSQLMVGLGGDMRLYESGDPSSGSTLSLALSGDLGYAQLKPGDQSGLALGIGAPVTIMFGATPEGMRIAPFFTPVFGIGSTTGGCPVAFPSCEESGIRWVLGGGIGVWNPVSSISASIGVNQVLLDGAKPVFGVNVTLGGR